MMVEDISFFKNKVHLLQMTVKYQQGKLVGRDAELRYLKVKVRKLKRIVDNILEEPYSRETKIR